MNLQMLRRSCLLVLLLLVGSRAQATGLRPPRPDVHVRVRVGEVYELSAEGVRSFSSTGPTFEVRVSSDQRKLLCTLLRPGSYTLLLLFTDSSQQRVVFEAR